MSLNMIEDSLTDTPSGSDFPQHIVTKEIVNDPSPNQLQEDRENSPGGMPSNPVSGDRPPKSNSEPASSSASPDSLAPLPLPSELLLAQLEGESSTDRRRFRRAILLATLFHVALFFIVFPEVRRETMHVGKPGRVYVMQQTRFQKPPPRAEVPEQQVPKKKAKRIPIPDPTPDDPEPIELLDIEIPDIEPTDVDEVIFGIPDGPDPGTGLTAGSTFHGDAMQLGDGVAKPESIFKPQPKYTEEARQARIQGVVILSGVVDENGEVKNLKIVKGLPLGLDKSALETVATWRFKPAVFEGKPVAVYFHFTVGFWLQ